MRRLSAGLVLALTASCGGLVERNQNGPAGVDNGEQGEPLDPNQQVPADEPATVDHLNLGVLQVLVPADGVPLQTLSYTVTSLGGRVIQEGRAKLTQTLSYDPSVDGTRSDLVFSISLPPGRDNVMTWTGRLGRVRCEGALGPFAIEALHTVTFLSRSNCDIVGG